LQAVQTLTAGDTQLKSQFAAHMCAQIVERDNLLHRFVFADESKLNISGHNCFIWGSEPHKEHLEHE
jgi:hypothetical protein